MTKKTKKRKLVCGVGINDANYTIAPTIDGKQVTCPYYSKWKSMLMRCYSLSYHVKYPTYADCVVCEEWKSFMAFLAWMSVQHWEDRELDKDVVVQGNKTYSPETCRFIPKQLNTLLTDSGGARGGWPIGVYFNKQNGKWMAQARIDGKKKYLGLFDCPYKAHFAYRKFKYKLIDAWADAYEDVDDDISQGLRNWVIPLY